MSETYYNQTLSNHGTVSSPPVTDMNTGVTAVTLYVSAVAASVITRIVEKDSDGRHKKWNLAVTDVFNDAFEEVDETEIWRRFTLMLHLENPPIDADMIQEICTGFIQFKSRVLAVVLESEPEEWANSDDDGDDGEEKGSNSIDSQQSNDSAIGMSPIDVKNEKAIAAVYARVYGEKDSQPKQQFGLGRRIQRCLRGG